MDLMAIEASKFSGSTQAAKDTLVPTVGTIQVGEGVAITNGEDALFCRLQQFSDRPHMHAGGRRFGN